MMEERIWLLVSLQLSGEATAEELEELKILLQQNPELSLRVEIVRNIWLNRSREMPADKKSSFNRHLQRLSNHLGEPVLKYENNPVAEEPEPFTKPVRRYRWLWVTSTVAASLLLFFLLFNLADDSSMPGRHSQVAGNTVSTKPGSKSKIELPDGTQVWLNADSRITYDRNWPGTQREVHLTGEAYFDVVRDESRPFIIHTSSIDVKVLGTSFNVRSYPNEQTTETALIHGSVEITLHNNPDKKIILKPKEKLIVKNDHVTVTDSNNAVVKNNASVPMLTLDRVRYYKKDTSSSIETMWVDNKLAFENEVFDRVVAEIERWYNVTITVKNESLAPLHFTGIFENKPLADVMEALSFSFKSHYEIKDDKVTIW